MLSLASRSPHKYEKKKNNNRKISLSKRLARAYFPLRGKTREDIARKKKRIIM